MSGLLLNNGGRSSHRLLVHHLRAPPSGDLSKPSMSHARAYVRSHPLSSKPRKSSLRVSPTVSFLLSHPSASTVAAASSASTSSFLRNGFVGWYLGMIESRPVLTKSLTAAAIFAAADISSQITTLTSPDNLDLVRTLRMAGYGMIILGPSLHFWYNFVARILPKQDMITTLKKMLLGQTTYGPLMTAAFFSVNAVLQGETRGEIIARLKRDMFPTVKRGFMYWPVCDFITFKFVPVLLQPLVCNSFSFLWTIYLTYMASLQKVSIQKN
ncbi:unnamed protein product [Musa hybrid cultivar]